MSDRPLRLGDVLDDYCPRCRLLLNHDIASLTGGQIAKVTCRTCYNTHDYRHGQVPDPPQRRRRTTTRASMDQVLAGMPRPPDPPRAARGRPSRSAATSGPRSSGSRRSRPAGMRAVDIIQKKRDGHELDLRRDRRLHRAATRAATIPDYQASALAMAVFFRGMTAAETVALTEAMMRTGEVLDLSRAARAQGGQALDGRRGRQDVAGAGPAGRGLRRVRADDLGPRARPHRRHARQAGVDPRLPRRPVPRRVPRRARASAASASSARRRRSRPPTASSTRCATSRPRWRACRSSPPPS